MFYQNTDREWEKFAATDPYFAVLTDDKYRRSDLTEKNKTDFFRSGYDYIDDVLSNIRKYIDAEFTPKKTLDFGCGVGRLVIPLAEIAEHVIGIDVSESMLNEAEKNCESRSIRNVSFLKSDDHLSILNSNYDFIHSFIVFPHIPVKRGERIFRNLLEHLKDGGVCVIHFTYAKTYKVKRLIPWIKNYIPLAKNFINLIEGRHFFYPQMQMNSYDLNKVFYWIQQNKIRDFYAQYTNHGGEFLGILVYFKKPKAAE
jgi:ubiquinone/menaquinone biosynthesis C-methylase UbiE